MKVVREAVLRAFPGGGARARRGRRGAGPVVMTRPSRLRARWGGGVSGAAGPAGRSSGAVPAPPPPLPTIVLHGGTASRMS